MTLVAAKLKKSMGAAAAKQELRHDSDSDSEDSFSGQQRNMRRLKSRRMSSFFTRGVQAEKLARMELKMIVESSDDAMFCIDEMVRGLLVVRSY